MSQNFPLDHLDAPLEPERYEFYAASGNEIGDDGIDLTRRDFLKALGGGILVVFTLWNGGTPDAGAQESGGGRRSGGRGAMPPEIGAWLHIAEDGTITVFSGKVEVGQNIRTSLAQVVADELRVPLESVRMVLGDTDLTPYDAGTFGSRTTPAMGSHLRKVAAAARELLLDLAATQAKVERTSLVVAEGSVRHPGSKQSFTFGQLTKGQKLMKAIGPDVTVTPPEQWKVAGQSAAKVGGAEIVTGAHKYTSDMRRPGMVWGKVLRATTLNATLQTLDAKAAEAMPGVTVVRDGDFVGVTAPNQHLAARAVEALRAEWKSEKQSSAGELYDYLKKNVDEQRERSGPAGDSRGSIETGLAAAAVKLEAVYNVAYIAHAPLEPRAAVAEWEDGKLTVWTGTQRPFGVRSELAAALGLPEDRIRVIVPDTGSGYGGKHTGEAAIEAARLAKAAGKPVKLVWTREEEFTWAYFRPAGVIDVRSGASRDGLVTAWECHNYNSGTAGIHPVYDFPNQKIQFHPTRSPLRQGSYRALASTANHFARETHMDELAHALKMELLEFRLKNLKDTRLRGVLEAAAQSFGWGRAKPAENHGFGIAGGFEKGGYVATCAEVAVDPVTKKVTVVRTVTAFDCGAVVNPEHLKNQIEGAVVQGLGGALFEAIDFGEGKILNARFSHYRVPRFSDLPTVEVVLVDRKDQPSMGAGEAPIVGIAPAVGNAIFHATGVRLRALPLVPRGVVLDVKV